jgi:ABC-type sugar transport system ATPase subunit
MISSEMPELLGISDRILVMHNNSIEGELSRKEASQESILKLAVGLKGEVRE